MYLNSLVIWCSLFVVFFAGVCFREVISEMVDKVKLKNEEKSDLIVNEVGELIEKE